MFVDDGRSLLYLHHMVALTLTKWGLLVSRLPILFFCCGCYNRIWLVILRISALQSIYPALHNTILIVLACGKRSISVILLHENLRDHVHENSLYRSPRNSPSPYSFHRPGPPSDPRIRPVNNLVVGKTFKR
jgi:hypothetical protein